MDNSKTSPYSSPGENVQLVSSIELQSSGKINPLITASSESGNPPSTTNEKGLTVFKAWLFIVGEMAGIGAMVYASIIFDLLFSSIILCLVGAIALYSGLKLSESWTTLAEDPKYYNLTKGCKEPYPVLTKTAFGDTGLMVSRLSVMITLVFITLIFIIMSSQNIAALLISFEVGNICVCEIMLILTILLIPFTWLPTPSDSWGIAVVAAFSTIIAFFFIAIQAFRDRSSQHLDFVNGFTHQCPENKSLPYYRDEFEGVEIADNETVAELGDKVIHTYVKAYINFPVFGTTTMFEMAKLLVVYIFGFGGMSIFPTIQCDMKVPREFNKVIYYSIGTLVVLYMSVMIPGYLNYEIINVNVLQSLDQKSWLTRISNLLMTSHLITALVILANPPMQQLELLILKDKRTPLKSKILRTIYMLLLLAFCYTVPKFDPFMMFVGATTIMLNTFILPSFIYLKIVHKVNFWEFKEVHRRVDTRNKVIISFVVLTGLFGSINGLIDLGNALLDPKSSFFTSPCWYDHDTACKALNTATKH